MDVIGQMAVAFLNRFAASAVTPEACVVDFADACRGKRDELGDIESNREHFEILGARLGEPIVSIRPGAQTADIAVSCSFDSRILSCDGMGEGCAEGTVGSVAGTCILTSVREPDGWRLCTSNFAGAPGPPASDIAQSFFGARR